MTGVGQFRILEHVSRPIEVGVVHDLEDFEGLRVRELLRKERRRVEALPTEDDHASPRIHRTRPAVHRRRPAGLGVVRPTGRALGGRTTEFHLGVVHFGFKRFLEENLGQPHTVGEHRGDHEAGQEHASNHGQTAFAPAPCGLRGQASALARLERGEALLHAAMRPSSLILPHRLPRGPRRS